MSDQDRVLAFVSPAARLAEQTDSMGVYINPDDLVFSKPGDMPGRIIQYSAALPLASTTGTDMRRRWHWAGDFQGQRPWTDWLPNADFAESIIVSTFDGNGPKAPTAFAAENDTGNGISIFENATGPLPCCNSKRLLITGAAFLVR